MSKFKGTKGKWECKNVNSVMVNHELIASVYGVMVKGKYTYTEEVKANALLISKALEMLEQHENDLKELQLLHDFIFNEQGYSIKNPNLVWIDNAIENKKQLIKQATEI